MIDKCASLAGGRCGTAAGRRRRRSRQGFVYHPGDKTADHRLAPFAQTNALHPLLQVDFAQLVFVHQLDEPADALHVEYVDVTGVRAGSGHAASPLNVSWNWIGPYRPCSPATGGMQSRKAYTAGMESIVTRAAQIAASDCVWAPLGRSAGTPAWDYRGLRAQLYMCVQVWAEF